MALFSKLRFWNREPVTETKARGNLGEKAAKEFLEAKGLKFLAANFSTTRGEIDLIFRDGDCLVFVEVKTRSSESWTRPARAVTAAKRRSLSRAAADYRRLLDDPYVKYRFDIVEVLLSDGKPDTVRHLEHSFRETFRPPKRR